jgi:putative ABC transport system permease protein
VIGVALKGLLGRKFRATLTGLAIVLGVAMVSGSFVLTDTIGKSFDTIFGESYEASDVVISFREATSGGDDLDAPGFPATLLNRVRALEDVEAVFPSVEYEAQLVDADGDLIGGEADAIGIGIDPSADQRLNPLVLVSGDWPRGNSQIAIDKATADKQDVAVGDSIGAVAHGPVHTYRVSGIVQYGSVESLGGATISVFDLATAQRLSRRQDKLDFIRVAGRAGVDSGELVGEIRPLLPPTAQVKTASAQATSDSEDTQEGLGYFRDFLLAFGGLALFVGAFVIANTMSITIAQRMRELATLRTLGASRRQVLTSVVLEALVIGLVASVIGLFLGLAIAKLLNVLLVSTGIDLPQTGLVFTGRTVLVSLLVGTLVAILASLRPAIRATRVPPIAAVREGAVLPGSRAARFGLPFALAVIGIGVGLLAFGVFASGLETATRLLSLAGGVLLLFVGVALLAPRLVPPLVRVLGAPGARLGGVAGQLASQNATRDPARTASTAAALMIGLALVTLVAVLGAGLRTSFTSAVDELFVADYALTGEGEPLAVAAGKAAAAAPGVEVVSSLRSENGEAFGEEVTVNGVEPNLSEVVDMTWHRGSGDIPAQLGRDGAFVLQDYAEEHDLELGSPLVLTTPSGERLRLEVKGIFAEPEGGSPFGEVAISAAIFDAAYPDSRSEFTFVNIRGGPTPANTTALENALRAFPGAIVETRDEFKDGQLSALNSVLNVLYALLGLSVVVSLFGIVNTLVLSVFERTRELGMLRAIGMTRRQVRRMIRYESIITALIGATLGIAVGLFLAALVTRALADEGLVFVIPYGSLAIFVLVAIAAGILAAVLPARRASRLNVLEALQYE